MNRTAIIYRAPVKLIANQPIIIPGSIIVDKSGRQRKKHGESKQPVDFERLRAQEVFVPSDVAVLLSVSESTVDNLIAKGFLKTVVLPGTERKRVVTRSQLDEYIRRAEQEHGFPSPRRRLR